MTDRSGRSIASVLAMVWAEDARKASGNKPGDPVYLCLRGLDLALFCAPRHMELERVIEEATLIEPRRWVYDQAHTCLDRDTNPCECMEDKDRQHWLLDCEL